MNPRKFGALLLILGFGAVVETAWAVRNNLGVGPSGCRVLGGRFYGPSYTFDSDLRREVPEGVSVELGNSFGGVRIVKGGPGEMRLVLRKVVFLPTEKQAAEFASKIRAEATLLGSVLQVKTNREELESGEGREVGFETHLELSLPATASVRIKNEHGRVEVADVARAEVEGSFEGIRVERVAGDAKVTGRHGDVSVASVAGGLTLSSRHGNVDVQDVTGRATLDSEHGSVTVARTGGLSVAAAHGDVSVQEVRGDLEVTAQHSEVRGSQVAGRAQVRTSFGGVHLKDVEGEVRAKADHGEVEVTDAKGAVFAEASFNGVSLERVAGAVDVTVSHGGLVARAIEAGAIVKSSGDDVLLDGFRGPIQVHAERAEVRLVPAGPLTATVAVTTTHSGISLEVPAGSRFQLEASTQHGEIQIELPGLTLTRTESSRIEGSMGTGGSLVRLEAQRGDVRVAASSVTASSSPGAAHDTER